MHFGENAYDNALQNGSSSFITVHPFGLVDY